MKNGSIAKNGTAVFPYKNKNPFGTGAYYVRDKHILS